MDDLSNILQKIDENTLKRLITTIKRTNEYNNLKGKTQIKNSAVEDEFYNKQLTNRQVHSYQVSQVAYQIVKSSGRTEKEALVAELVGICHDLGHTPFGHDGEDMFTEKTGKEFNHAKYGAKLFDKVFKEVLNSKQKKNGKAIFPEETRESLEELQSFVKAGIFSEEIIQNLLGLDSYIKAGVRFHQEGYYSFDLDKKLANLQEEFKKTGEYTEELDLLEKVLKNPCIQAGMLADTVSIMQSDVRDMLSAKNPYDNSTTIITIENEMQVASKIGFTKENIAKIQEEVFGEKLDMDDLDINTALRQTLEMIGKTSVSKIQATIAKQIGKNGLNEKGRFESISDQYKIFADGNKRKYEELTGEKIEPEKWKNFCEEKLQEQRDFLKEKNPLLCLTYEIQNQLMYNEIIYGDKIKLLNNDLDRNKAIFSRVYDYLYEVTDKSSSELRDDEIEVRKEMMRIYKQDKYPKQFDEKTKEDKVKNLVIFRMQQMGNKELKQFYNERIASKENAIQTELDILEQEERTESEIEQIILGKNTTSYQKFKEEDNEKKQTLESFVSKTDQEISSKLRIEKRDIEEIKQNKTTLSRNIEYNMTYQEMEQVEENLGKGELEQKSDMASFVWSSNMNEGEEFVVDMEMLVRNALAYVNITTEDVKQAENTEQTIANQDQIMEGVNQRGE